MEATWGRPRGLPYYSRPLVAMRGLCTQLVCLLAVALSGQPSLPLRETVCRQIGCWKPKLVKQKITRQRAGS